MNVVQMELGHLILMLVALLGAGVAGVYVTRHAGRCPVTTVMATQTDPQRRGWEVCRPDGRGCVGVRFRLNAVL